MIKSNFLSGFWQSFIQIFLNFTLGVVWRVENFCFLHLFVYRIFCKTITQSYNIYWDLYAFFSENLSVSEPNMISICSHHLWFFPLTLLLFPMKCTVHSSWSTWCWWYDWITVWRIVFLFVLWSFLSCQPHFLKPLFWISQNRLLTLLIFVYIGNSNMNCISVIAANSFSRWGYFVKHSFIPEGIFVGLRKAAVKRRSLRYEQNSIHVSRF